LTAEGPARYLVEFTSAARKQLRGIDPPVRRRVLAAISLLATDPRPAGCKALSGAQLAGVFRIRVGDYRVLYVVEDAALSVLVVGVGHRSQVYRSL